MKYRKSLNILLLSSFIVTSNCFSQHASFQGLGDFPGGTFESSAISVSDDGSIVAGYGTADSGAQAFRWTQITGLVSLGNLPDSSFKQCWANSISANGTVIVGYGDPVGLGWDTYKGFIWIQANGMTEIGSLEGSSRFMAFSVSADGSVVVGDGGQQAFLWKQNEGIQGLGTLTGRAGSRAVAVSADGSIVIGSSYNIVNSDWTSQETFRWTQNGGMQGLGLLSGTNYSFPNAISPDGNVIAGTSVSSSRAFAYRWSQSTGMVSIGYLPGTYTTHPGGVSLNGEIIVGGSYVDMTNGQAFIWDSTHGMRNLKTVLQTEYGLDLTGWTLQSASGITPDGNVIVGWGINPSGNQEAYRVVLDTLETVTDIDGNVYQTVKIGTQVWMKENLKTTRYRNGDPIPNITDQATWIGLTTGAYCNYNNDTTQVAVFGRLYNWYTVSDSRNICPTGWHIPSDNEWLTLALSQDPNTYWDLGVGHESYVAGGKMKEADTTHWLSPNTGASNSSGFTALPGGQRSFSDGSFASIRAGGNWWSATKYDATYAFGRSVNYDGADIYRFNHFVNYGFSIRCVKDGSTGVNDPTNGKQIPREMKLNQNYPNPFNPSTVISYRLSASSNVRLKIYDMLGREIKTLVNCFQSTGEHSVVWNTMDDRNTPMSSGVYFYKLEAGTVNLQKKMLLIR